MSEENGNSENEEIVDPNRITLAAAYNALLKKYEAMDKAFTDTCRVAEQEILNKNDLLLRQQKLLDSQDKTIDRLNGQIAQMVLSSPNGTLATIVPLEKDDGSETSPATGKPQPN